MDIVKVGWSGGKDSTCATHKRILRGDKVKAVCYVPMFTEEIPLVLKSHYEYINNTANLFRSMGAEVYIVSGITYWDYCTHIAKSGKHKGKMFGFPCFKTSQCGFKRDSKLPALNKIDVGEYDYEDIGIAYDEIKRHGQLNEKKRSILVEEQITEFEALQYCIKNNILSPNYATKKRDGCTLCPNAKEKERQEWYKDYPQAVPLLMELQRIVNQHRPENKPLRENKWFIPEKGLDGYQPTLFDFMESENENQSN